MVSIAAVVLLAFCAAFVYNATAIWLWLRTAWVCRKLPNGSGNFIYGGILKALSFNRLREFRNMNERVVQGSGVFYFQFLWRQMVVVTEPRLMAQIMLDKTLHKPVKPDYARFRKMMGPDQVSDLVASEGDQNDWLWKAVRKGVAPAFAPHALRAAYPKVQHKAAELTSALSKLSSGGEAVDMAYALMCESMDMLGLAGFQKEYHNVKHLSKGEPAEVLDVIMEANAEVCKSMQNPLYDLYLKLPGVHPVGQAKIKQFHGIMSNLLAEVRARGVPAEDDTSIAAQLMRIQDPRTGQLLADKFLLPQFSVLFWAGYDTTGNAMAWTLFCISQHPEVEQKIVEELQSLGLVATAAQAEPRVPDHADLAKLTYLSCVIKEAMRVHTVAGIVTMRMSRGRDLVLDGGKIVIPRDTIINLPVGCPHTSSALFEEADLFRPERWLELDADYVPTGLSADIKPDRGSQDDKDRVLRFMPFSMGTRNCVGMALAKMNYTCVLGHLLGRFSFKLASRMGGAEGVLKAQKLELLLTPSTGMWMHCQPRGI